jgi:hypothetical protein
MLTATAMFFIEELELHEGQQPAYEGVMQSRTANRLRRRTE